MRLLNNNIFLAGKKQFHYNGKYRFIGEVTIYCFYYLNNIKEVYWLDIGTYIKRSATEWGSQTENIIYCIQK